MVKWMLDCNTEQPHDSLNDMTPKDYLFLNHAAENSGLA